MKEVVSLPEENNGYISILEFYLALIFIGAGFFSDSDMVSILIGTMFSLFYIFRHDSQSIWVCTKGIVLGLLIFWGIQLALALNIFNNSGQWPRVQFGILKSALPLIIISSLLFGLVKWLIKKPPTIS